MTWLDESTFKALHYTVKISDGFIFYFLFLSEIKIVRHFLQVMQDDEVDVLFRRRSHLDIVNGGEWL